MFYQCHKNTSVITSFCKISDFSQRNYFDYKVAGILDKAEKISEIFAPKSIVDVHLTNQKEGS